jgi:hypothetical protein
MGSQSEGGKSSRGRNKMNEKQMFSVLVRGVGLVVFLNGSRALWLSFMVWVWRDSMYRSVFPPEFGTQDLIYGLLVLVLGLTMIRWPGWLVNLAWLEKLPTIGRMPDDEN